MCVGQKITSYKNGPSWGRTSDQPGRVDNRRAILARFQLPPSEPCMHLSMHTALQGYGLLSRNPLYPFPVYQALPWSFEYYGYSVAMCLSTFRRSPSSLTHHVCT